MPISKSEKDIELMIKGSVIGRIIGAFFLIITSMSFAQKVEWANELREVSSERFDKQFSGKQALGKPNVLPQGGESSCAWEPYKESNKKGEMIYVRFQNPLFTKQVVVAESRNPGAISKIEFLPPFQFEWQCKSPFISPRVIKFGSLFSRDASISPLSSLSSGDGHFIFKIL